MTTKPEFDFKPLQVNAQQTSNYTIYSIENTPTLTLAPANQVHKAYFNEVLRRNSQASRVKAQNVALLEKNREEDRELYAKYILKGWKNVKDRSGNDVAFSQENALAFLQAIPDYIFDEIRIYAQATENFLSPSAETAAKNSESGSTGN